MILDILELLVVSRPCVWLIMDIADIVFSNLILLIPGPGDVTVVSPLKKLEALLFLETCGLKKECPLSLMAFIFCISTIL
jgi:hypothetical protein